MKARSEEAIKEEMEKLISDRQTYRQQSRKEKPQKLAKILW
ncbi:MAG: hypothetical protein ACXV2C_04250 [Candidatus Bathyarchaeia archaeon]